MNKLIDLAQSIPASARRWTYRVAAAGFAVAAGYGLISSDHALLWLALASVVLGVADANVTDPTED